MDIREFPILSEVTWVKSLKYQEHLLSKELRNAIGVAASLDFQGKDEYAGSWNDIVERTKDLQRMCEKLLSDLNGFDGIDDKSNLSLFLLLLGEYSKQAFEILKMREEFWSKVREEYGSYVPMFYMTVGDDLFSMDIAILNYCAGIGFLGNVAVAQLSKTE